MFAEVVEIEVAIELGCGFIDGIHDHRASTEFSSSPDGAAERVDEEVTPQMLALFAAVEGEPGQEYNGDRVGHPSAGPGWSLFVDHGAHRQRVVADDTDISR
jgi:hypothetical protein